MSNNTQNHHVLALEGQTLYLVSAQAERGHQKMLVSSSAQDEVKPIGCPANCDAEKQHCILHFQQRMNTGETDSPCPAR